MMDKENGTFIAKTHHAHSQDVWLTLDTPVMCVKNNKKLGLKNGKMYRIKAIEKDKIKMEGLTCNFVAWQSHFVVAFAFTNHKVQGVTIKEPFNIYEWDKMTEREQYTAYSRCTDCELVAICQADFDMSVGRRYWIYKWESHKSNQIYVGHTNNLEKREQEHLRDRVKRGNKLYRHMRETGFDTWRMAIVEEFIACNRAEAEEKEQEYMDKLKPTLNMCRASNSVL
jgi:predicted GIY-YIG superfamily endonuclease